jgi:hypothetical protein
LEITAPQTATYAREQRVAQYTTVSKSRVEIQSLRSGPGGINQATLCTVSSGHTYEQGALGQGCLAAVVSRWACSTISPV